MKNNHKSGLAAVLAALLAAGCVSGNTSNSQNQQKGIQVGNIGESDIYVGNNFNLEFRYNTPNKSYKIR